MWVATYQVYPSGSTSRPQRSPQNMFETGPWAFAPSFKALATTLSTFSTIRYSVVGEAPTFFALRAPISGTGDPIRWLSVSPASGTVARPYLDVSIVTVQVDP